MKKTFFVILMLTLMLLVVGCSKKAFDSSSVLEESSDVVVENQQPKVGVQSGKDLSMREKVVNYNADIFCDNTHVGSMTTDEAIAKTRDYEEIAKSYGLTIASADQYSRSMEGDVSFNQEFMVKVQEKCPEVFQALMNMNY